MKDYTSDELKLTDADIGDTMSDVQTRSMTAPAMTFHYDDKTLKVIDNETRVEMRVRGRTEVGMMPFEFFDPSSSAHSLYGAGRFRFDAHLVTHVEKIMKKDGSVVTHTQLDGFRIDRKNLWVSFSQYTAQIQLSSRLFAS